MRERERERDRDREREREEDKNERQKRELEVYTQSRTSIHSGHHFSLRPTEDEGPKRKSLHTQGP